MERPVSILGDIARHWIHDAGQRITGHLARGARRYRGLLNLHYRHRDVRVFHRRIHRLFCCPETGPAGRAHSRIFRACLAGIDIDTVPRGLHRSMAMDDDAGRYRYQLRRILRRHRKLA